ncbi:hypothetical protein [Lysobacter claricitrinus]|uniref:hypothetical protein n=1 Tax=Lysobacter claricitrinus TaxID=3367728 RepID=UPI0037DAABD1
MRRILSLALAALIAPACVHAQSSNGPAPSAPATGADTTPAKAKPKSAFGAVMAELTRAAQQQAAAGHKPAASNAAAPTLPPPPRASANATLADSSGG